MGTVGKTMSKESPGAFERERDTATIRYFEEIGVSSGWRCLEVGGGEGTIAEWLCQRVGTAGHVVATDLDTRSLEAIVSPNIEVRRHDIVNDDLGMSSTNPSNSRQLCKDGRLFQRSAYNEVRSWEC